MKKGLNCNFVAVLTHMNDAVTAIPLMCREYHANKLAYVLSRSASRTYFKKVEVLSLDAFLSDPQKVAAFCSNVLGFVPDGILIERGENG